MPTTIPQPGDTLAMLTGHPAAVRPAADQTVTVTTVSEYDELMRRLATDNCDVMVRSGFRAPGERPDHLIYTDTRGRVLGLGDQDLVLQRLTGTALGDGDNR